MIDPLSDNCQKNRQMPASQPGIMSPFVQGAQTTGASPFIPTPSMGPMMPSTLPAFPTGMPSGPPTGAMPVPSLQGLIESAQPSSVTPETVADPLYLAGFLRTIIGRRVRVEFLIGTCGTTDRTGVLVGVGASYIILREIDQDDLVVCDLFSIKFVTVIL